MFLTVIRLERNGGREEVFTPLEPKQTKGAGSGTTAAAADKELSPLSHRASHNNEQRVTAAAFATRLTGAAEMRKITGQASPLYLILELKRVTVKTGNIIKQLNLIVIM